jgi:acyl CoA:acetate/3-ketoacid CoA transferase beta subunit
MLSDAGTVLGSLVGGAGTTTIGCLGGAQIDRNGNINSTMVPGGAFLVGSGGGNDVASVAAECVVVATLNPTRTPERCGYITSPGRAVRALVTDLGLLEKLGAGGSDDELVLTAVPAGPEPMVERIERARAACGWDLRVAEAVADLPSPEPDEVGALRAWDPRGWFLRAR